MATFTDRCIVITGASEGIGRALSLALAPQGPRLVLAARNVARLESAAMECERLGAKVLGVPTDVTDAAACAALCEAAVQFSPAASMCWSTMPAARCGRISRRSRTSGCSSASCGSTISAACTRRTTRCRT